MTRILFWIQPESCSWFDQNPAQNSIRILLRIRTEFSSGCDQNSGFKAYCDTFSSLEPPCTALKEWYLRVISVFHRTKVPNCVRKEIFSQVNNALCGTAKRFLSAVDEGMSWAPNLVLPMSRSNPTQIKEILFVQNAISILSKDFCIVLKHIVRHSPLWSHHALVSLECIKPSQLNQKPFVCNPIG